MVISMSLTLWLFNLKWTPVALDWLFVLTYVLCSENLSLSCLSVSTMYCCEHFLARATEGTSLYVSLSQSVS